MRRLLYIEWLKVSKSKTFMWMMGLWLLSFLAVPFGVDSVLDWLEGKELVKNLMGIAPSSFPIFSYIDIWHNLGYLYKFLTPLLCIIVIVNVGQEWEEKTMRQNVIDGLSRSEYFLSKTLLIFMFSAASTFLLFLMGLILGSLYSNVSGGEAIFGHMDFLGGYFLHVFLHLSLPFLFINLLRKIGLTTLLFLVGIYVVEPIMNGVASALTFFAEMPDLGVYLPFNASWNLLPFPFGKYVMSMTPDHLVTSSLLIALAWIALTMFFNYRLTTKRDLR